MHGHMDVRNIGSIRADVAVADTSYYPETWWRNSEHTRKISEGIVSWPILWHSLPTFLF